MGLCLKFPLRSIGVYVYLDSTYIYLKNHLDYCSFTISLEDKANKTVLFLALFPTLGRKNSVCYYQLYYLEHLQILFIKLNKFPSIPFSERFYRKWMMIFFKCFFWITLSPLNWLQRNQTGTNTKKIREKSPNTWKLSNTLLNLKVKEEASRKIKR